MWLRIKFGEEVGTLKKRLKVSELIISIFEQCFISISCLHFGKGKKKMQISDHDKKKDNF